MQGGCPRGLMVKELDSGFVKSEFEHQSRYYIYFQTNALGKGLNPLILPAMGQIASLLFFKKNGVSIKYPMTVDIPLQNKERNIYAVVTYILNI